MVPVVAPGFPRHPEAMLEADERKTDRMTDASGSRRYLGLLYERLVPVEGGLVLGTCWQGLPRGSHAIHGPSR